MDEVAAFDLGLQSWKPMPRLPQPLFGAAGAVWRDEFYLIGGGNCDGASQVLYRMPIGGRRERWAAWRLLPFPVSHSSAAVIGDDLIVLGGVADPAQFHAFHSQVSSINLASPRAGWRALAPIPGPGRALFATAVINGDVFIFGGCSGTPDGIVNLNSAARFNPRSEKWRPLPDVPLATRAWSAAPWQDRYIFLFGGYSQCPSDGEGQARGQFEARVFRYDTLLERYEETSSLPFALADVSFQADDKAFYGAGGEPGAGKRSAALLIGQVHIP